MQPTRLILPFLGAAALAACSSTPFDSEEALATNELRFQLDDEGNATSYRYAVVERDLPEQVLVALSSKHPEGSFSHAEMVHKDGEPCYSVTQVVDGYEVEALYWPDGTLDSESVEVPASAVPADVVQKAQNTVDGEVTMWRERRDGDGELLRYTAMTELDDVTYGMTLTPDGELLDFTREVQAGVKIPVSTIDS